MFAFTRHDQSSLMGLGRPDKSVAGSAQAFWRLIVLLILALSPFILIDHGDERGQCQFRQFKLPNPPMISGLS